MQALLNTLFITTEKGYATLDGENVVIKSEDQELGRVPLHRLQGIVSFSYAGASPALMGACASRGIDLAFCSPRGRFLARTSGFSKGNVLLRLAQYNWSQDEARSCQLARLLIFGKLSNCRRSLDRTRRDHAMRVDGDSFAAASDQLRDMLPQVLEAQSLETLRGLEGAGATVYFGLLDAMILQDKEHFFFHQRNRRPPLDRVNAALSFVYTLLASQCASALEAAGLDSSVGFLHRVRPGRNSLALDLLEELRPCLADRFVLTLINDRVLAPDDFISQENGAVLLNDEGRRKVLSQWQKRKQAEIVHPFLREKVPWGLVPHLQALLLARFLRGDLEDYPPFLWR